MHVHEGNFLIACDDLKAAKILIKEGSYRVAIFLLQQSTEKALKAYLAFMKKPLVRTHDLTMLIEKCVIFDKEFLVFFEHAKILTPYATRGRYIDDYVEIDGIFVKKLARDTAKILRHIQKRIACAVEHGIQNIIFAEIEED